MSKVTSRFTNLKILWPQVSPPSIKPIQRKLTQLHLLHQTLSFPVPVFLDHMPRWSLPLCSCVRLLWSGRDFLKCLHNLYWCSSSKLLLTLQHQDLLLSHCLQLPTSAFVTPPFLKHSRLSSSTALTSPHRNYLLATVIPHCDDYQFLSAQYVRGRHLIFPHSSHSNFMN